MRLGHSRLAGGGAPPFAFLSFKSGHRSFRAVILVTRPVRNTSARSSMVERELSKLDICGFKSHRALPLYPITRMLSLEQPMRNTIQMEKSPQRGSQTMLLLQIDRQTNVPESCQTCHSSNGKTRTSQVRVVGSSPTWHTKGLQPGGTAAELQIPRFGSSSLPSPAKKLST